MLAGVIGNSLFPGLIFFNVFSMRYLVFIISFLFACNTCLSQVINYDKDLSGQWEGAGFSGLQKDIITGQISFGINGFAKNGGFNIDINLSTPAQKNKVCAFRIESTSINNITVSAKDFQPFFSDQPICNTGVDDSNNLVYNALPNCISSVKINFIRKNNQLFTELLLFSSAKECEGKLYFWPKTKSLVSPEEINVANLFADYQLYQKSSDSVRTSTGIDSKNDHGAFDQQYLRSKIRHSTVKCMFDYFPEDEMLLVRYPFISTFALHLTNDEYKQLDATSKIEFINVIVNKDDLSLNNALLIGLIPSRPVYFPDKKTYERNKVLLKKYTPGLLEDDKLPGNNISKNENNGIGVLFNNTNSKLSAEEKEDIYRLLDFRLVKDGNKFTEKSSTDDAHGFSATLKIIDLNKDGVDEVIVNRGNSFTSGVARGSGSLFIKNAAGKYQKNPDFGGDIFEIVTPGINGFPDLSISAPGLKIPIWRYDGFQYKYLYSTTTEGYKKLHHQSLSAFTQSNKPVVNSALQKKEDGISNYRFTAPNASSIHFIYNRWKAIDVSGNNHEGFMQRKKKGEIMELQFLKDHKVYFYKNGVLDFVFEFVIAPDGKSMLLSRANNPDQLSIKIVSLTAKELIIQYPLFQNDMLILNAK